MGCIEFKIYKFFICGYVKPIKNKSIMRKNLSKEDVISMLNRHNGISVNSRGTITINPETPIGIKTWSKIDYLIRYHNFVVIKSKEISSYEKPKEDVIEETAVKHNKLNLVKMVKMSMK